MRDRDTQAKGALAGGTEENQQRSVLVEMHREAQTFFVKQLEGTPKEKPLGVSRRSRAR